MLLLKSWLDLVQQLLTSPVILMGLFVALIVLLFLISRLNNYLEVRGVDRAIAITRGIVGSFIWFIVVPTALFIFVNVVALIFQVPLVSISFLGNWIGLTASSYWWLLRCMFNSADLNGADTSYSLHSIIRILWILIPFSLIWFRTNKGRIPRLILIPIIIVVFVVTQGKKADETFITKQFEMETLRALPVIGFVFEEPEAGTGQGSMHPTTRKIISVVLVLFVLGGLAAGLVAEQRVIGLIVVAVGIGGFMLIMPSGQTKDILAEGLTEEEKKESPFHHDIDSLVHRLDSFYELEGVNSLEVYYITVKLDAAYRAQREKEPFPDSLCLRYKDFFYDWCH